MENGAGKGVPAVRQVRTGDDAQGVGRGGRQLQCLRRSQLQHRARRAYLQDIALLQRPAFMAPEPGWQVSRRRTEEALRQQMTGNGNKGLDPACGKAGHGIIAKGQALRRAGLKGAG